MSQSTVSRALRGDSRVAERTTLRVAEAARELDYVPSDVARSLSTRSTRQAAIVADLDNALYPVLVAPLHDALGRAGYRMVVLAERGDEAATYSRLLDRSADAVVLTTTTLRSSLPDDLARRGVPFVMLNRYSDVAAGDAVTSDNTGGAAAATQVLLDQGYERVGALLGPRQTSTGRDRERGFRSALRRARVPYRASWVHRGWFDDAAGRAGLQAVMAGADRPDALFCAGDSMAVGALNAALALGLRVPEDLALIGFDDLPMAGWESIRLSTVHVPLHEMAERAVEMLVERLRGHAGPPRHVVLPTRVVRRATHGRP